MKYVYGIFALLALLSGIVIFLTAKTAVQEIEGLIFLLLSAVLMVAAEVAELAAAQRPAHPDTAIDTRTIHTPTAKS